MIKKIGICLGVPSLFTWDKINNDIVERKNLSPYYDNGQLWYGYDEYHYTAEEYIETRLSKIGADVDYISMMTEVDL